MKKHLLTIASVAMIAGVISFSSCKKDDTTAPSITVTGGNSQTASLNSSWSNPSATAADDVDGDLSTSITVGGDVVNTNLAGIYDVTYTVSDAAGNTSTETVTVTVVNDAAFLAGVYSADDTCQQSWVSPYSMTWAASSTINNQLSINNLSNFGTSVNITVNRVGNTLTFPAPQTIGTLGSFNSGNGTFTNPSGNTVAGSFTWQWTDAASNTEVCTTTMSK
ncbi:MAG: DUF5011 domain-containing protein [Bacteroidota bacterium]|nr:DUF5011 domain-containing protein [Bacteroidota bacterium]